MMRFAAWVVVVFSIGLCACEPKAQTASSKPLTAPDDRVEQLEKQVAQLEVNAHLSKIRQDLYDKIVGRRIDAVTGSPATIEPENSEFGIARNQFGSFTVAAEKVEPYLDGYKLSLRFGNISAASFSGATVKILWGPNGFDSEKEFQVPLRFLPGRYTSYEFVLAPAKPVDIKQIRVGIEFTQISIEPPLDQ